MQHLVKQDVFDGVAGHTRMVKNAADHDGVVGGIVMAETAAGVVSAPGQLWTTHQAVKEAPIEVVKNLFQMIGMAAGGADVLASAHLRRYPGVRCSGGNEHCGCDQSACDRAWRAGCE